MGSSSEIVPNSSARLFAEKDWVREEAKKCELLNALFEHQQRCLSEALQDMPCHELRPPASRNAGPVLRRKRSLLKSDQIQARVGRRSPW